MKRSYVVAIMLLAWKLSISQEQSKSGRFELGTRTTISLFENDGHAGFGSGGQFRIWLGNSLNTEWYADFITTNISNLGNRKTTHIGWSVMFYPLNSTRKLSPYLIAGHCFDRAKITVYDDHLTTKSRRSAAVQVGLGTSLYLTEKLDLSISGQYMIHIGDDIHTYEIVLDGKKTLTFDNPDSHQHAHSKGTAMEGHILITTSINYKIGRL